MRRFYRTYIMPGLVIQAVVVGGGYATGRELVEFFLSKGLATGLLGLIVTTVLFSIGGAISFEIARRHHAFDYQRFCKTYMGRFNVLFEAGYFATLLLALAVVSAAAAELIARTLGTPMLLNSAVFMATVAILLFYGDRLIENVGSGWSLAFYLIYGFMICATLWRFGGDTTTAWQATDLDIAAGIREGFSYTGYNIVVLPVLIFVARNFGSRREAVLSGVLSGPLILLPAFGFLIAMASFYPAILDQPLPVSTVIERIEMPVLSLLVQLIIIGALIKTGTGLLHGLNERVAREAAERGRDMPRALRPTLAVLAMTVAVWGATKVGLIDLIGEGYRYSSAYFLIVFLLPLMTLGVRAAFGNDTRNAKNAAR